MIDLKKETLDDMFMLHLFQIMLALTRAIFGIWVWEDGKLAYVLISAGNVIYFEKLRDPA